MSRLALCKPKKKKKKERRFRSIDNSVNIFHHLQNTLSMRTWTDVDWKMGAISNFLSGNSWITMAYRKYSIIMYFVSHPDQMLSKKVSSCSYVWWRFFLTHNSLKKCHHWRETLPTESAHELAQFDKSEQDSYFIYYILIYVY